MIPTQYVLGGLAGLTILVGLPIAVLPRVTDRLRGFLNAMSTGILLFLLVEIMGKLIEWLEELFESAAGGFPTLPDAVLYSVILIVGLAVGLGGMVWFEERFIRGGKDANASEASAFRLAMMIAIGIGLHNLTEGLAIAQTYAWGDQQLAWFLTLGFALHNTTEGFGIAAPLSGHRPGMPFLALLGLVAGGPTFLGAVLGSYWQSNLLKVFSLALASGGILYLVGELLHLGRHLKGEAIVEIGLLLGFTLAFATEMLLVVAGF